jgi:glycosyltransferase involved in cell wall biosynthesis
MAKDKLDISKVNRIDLVCFSHLRWNFVYQRPQHLMSRFGKLFRTFYIEEPVFHTAPDAYRIKVTGKNVSVVTPFLNNQHGNSITLSEREKQLVDSLFFDKQIDKHIAWYYTPMALKFTNHLRPEIIIYDCMDELAAFKYAPPELKILESILFSKAHLVFTGGNSLYHAKKKSHPNVYPFPSSIDKEHFLRCRKNLAEPQDQKAISHLRLGFYGVIDERLDIELIKQIAEKRPRWQLIFIGPVVKIDPADLPKYDNIHYLGSKSYEELPYYLAGWDFAIIPFARNESTKFISPTKTPEYLAAGKPVISTSITDVVFPYGAKKLVYIADNADEFIAAADTEMAKNPVQKNKWLLEVDIFLQNISWDLTALQMIKKVWKQMNGPDVGELEIQKIVA